MSTPEARLRQMVGQFEQRRRRPPDSSAQTAQPASDERRAQRVRLAAQAYTERTQTLIAATGKPIYHAVHDARTGHGFALDVGRWPALQVDLVADTWQVALRNRLRNVFHVTFDTDDALLDAKDELLEPLVANALAAFERGTELPADARGRRKQTFPRMTIKASKRATGIPVYRRPTMLAVYAVAFAAGFVLAPLLTVRPSAPPPAATSNNRSVHRPPAVAAAYRKSRSNHSTGPSLRTIGVSQPRPLLTPASAARAGSVSAPTTVLAIDPPTPGGVGATTENARRTLVQAPRFHIQVGVFTTPDDAREVVKRLESLGYAAALSDREGYPVWVGGYLDQDTADRLAADVRKAGFDAVLVP